MLKTILIVSAMAIVVSSITAIAVNNHFSQYANEDLQWIGSIIQSSNSVYYENMAVPQRIIFEGLNATAGNNHYLTFGHHFTKGGVHAYDFLVGWDQAILLPIIQIHVER